MNAAFGKLQLCSAAGTASCTARTMRKRRWVSSPWRWLPVRPTPIGRLTVVDVVLTRAHAGAGTRSGNRRLDQSRLRGRYGLGHGRRRLAHHPNAGPRDGPPSAGTRLRGRVDFGHDHRVGVALGIPVSTTHNISTAIRGVGRRGLAADDPGFRRDRRSTHAHAPTSRARRNTQPVAASRRECRTLLPATRNTTSSATCVAISPKRSKFLAIE